MSKVFNPQLAIALVALAMAFAFAPCVRAGESITVIKGIYVRNTHRQPEYVSEVFTVNSGGSGHSTAWIRFVLTKHHVQDSITCRRAGGPHMTEAQARAYEKSQWAKNRAAGYKVIEIPESAWNELSAAGVAYLKKVRPDLPAFGGGCLILQAEGAAERQKRPFLARVSSKTASTGPRQPSVLHG
jgi:hypothetical protein